MLHDIQRAVIIYNPLSGGDRGRRSEQLKRAQGNLSAYRILAELLPTSSPGDAGRLACAAARDGAQLIVVCGGDGTVNETVNGMARDEIASQVPLAVLPAGTANVLAKELRIPWDIPRAAAMIPRGTPVRIALGRIVPLASPKLDRYFVCVGGAGADAALVRALDIKVKHRVGILAYWMEGFRQLWKYQFPHFRVTPDNGRSSEVALAIIGRTKHYGGPFQITTGANLFGDEFEVALFRSRRALSYIAYMPAAWTGNLRKLKNISFLTTRSLICEPLDESEIYAQVDGEQAPQLAVKFEIVPNALTIVVPELVAAAASRPAMVTPERATAAMAASVETETA
jgi:YegS/Rv2252/BmrU family lipid kinase